MDACSETDGRGALSGCKHCAVGSFLDVFQDLGFSGTGIAEEEDVDVSADGVFSVDIFGDAAEERQCDGCFDIFVTIDTGGDGVDDLLLERGSNGSVLSWRCWDLY